MGDVLIDRNGASVTITLNRPQARNALLKPLVEEVTRALDSAAGDRSLRAVVLTGAGGHFCAGADLRRTMAEDPELLDHLDLYMDAYHGLIRAIVRCPVPVIAQLDGCAVGFGADMALACDMRLASTEAYIQEKFVKIGLMPDGGGTFWLPRLVGVSRAARYMYLADIIDAKAMVDLGLVVDCVPASELATRTAALVTEVSKVAPLAIRETKRALYAYLGDIEGALRNERTGQLRLLRSNDLIEGVMAWSQKRDPDFKGE
jgi:enoyl-CoA hydratase/carnithine racemase